MPTVRGISGLGNINSISDYNKVKGHLCGFWRFRFDANDINTSAGTYDYSPIEDNVAIVEADDFYFGFQVGISPTSITPSFWFTAPNSVPICTGGSGQTYPDYLNATFIALKAAMIDAIRARIKNTWLSGRKSKFIYWYECSGKTGDEGTGLETVAQVTINGVVQPNPTSYQITEAQWSNYKRTSVWPQFKANLVADLPLTLLAINPSNDATDWAWTLANIANVPEKVGQVSHNYNNIGELFYAQRMNALTATVPNNMTFGEFENLDETTWFQSAPKQNMFAQICSFMAHGGTQMNIAVSTFKNVIDIDNATDWEMFDFANEVMGVRNPTESNIGWIVFRDIIDGTDLVRFPENIYGAVVAASQYKSYNRKYQAIYNSNDSQEVKNDKYAALLLAYFNDARRTAIAPNFPQLNLLPLDGSNDHDAYNQDFIIYGLTGGNYSGFLTQYDPNNTSIGYARIGNKTTDYLGRTGRAPNNEISVSVDNRLMGDASYNVTFDIWYLNEPNRSWSLNYFNSTFLERQAAEVVVNTGDNTITKKTITISFILGGGNLSNHTDWTLKTESDDATIFLMVKMTVNAQNAQILPVPGKVSNDISAICPLLGSVYYTVGAFGIGKIVYNDYNATTPITQSYFSNVYTGTIYNVDTSTGEILSATAFACGSGTQGIYILGNSLGSICSGSNTLLYTDGAFGSGKILYYNSSLYSAVVGYDYIVDTTTSTIYNLNSSTGVVGTVTGFSCTGGTAGIYRAGNNTNTICALTPTTYYTDGQFASGKTIYTNVSLTTPLTGFSYIVTANGLIYNLNSGTGIVGLLIGECGAGVAYTFRRGNDRTTICAQSTLTLYVNNNVIIGEVIYTDDNLITPLTGYDYVELTDTNTVFSVNNATGEITAQVGYCGAGAAKSLILGNFKDTICNGTPQTLYTDIPFGIGATLYYDINLTDYVINFDYVLDPATGIVYDLNFHTSIVYGKTGIICNSGVSGSYRLGNSLSTICNETPQTLYTNGAFGIGKTLYSDVNLTTIYPTPYSYVVDVSTGYIYTLYNSVVIALTSGVCGGGISAEYKVSNVVTDVCLSGTVVTLYTRTTFAVGVFLYTDVNLLNAFTGYTYLVNPLNDYIYIINPLTGEVLQQTNYACTANLYIPDIDDFYVKVAKYIKSCNCPNDEI